MSDREGLAGVIDANTPNVVEKWSARDGSDSSSLVLADRILASAWLAEHDREVRRAEATAIADDMDRRPQCAMFSFIARDRATSDDAAPGGTG